MPTTTASGRLIEVEGSALAAEADAQIESVLVVDRLARPDMFEIVFRDPAKNVLGNAGLDIGKTVKISTVGLGADAPEPLITAEVTSIEAAYDTLGARAVVRGYDRSHRLAAGRKTATYQNVKYSDIAQQIASAAGLETDTDTSDGTLDHVFQVNQSDLDFLYAMAREIGFDCRVDDRTLIFKKPVPSSGAPGEGDADSTNPVQLVWGSNLLEFRARMSAVAQVAKVEVRGWDPEAKDKVVGSADATATNAQLSVSAGDLASRVGGQTLVVTDHPVSTQQGADQLATARAQQVGSAAFEATAVAVGSSSLKAGTAVSISGIDPALAGKWVVSGSRHEFGNGAYKTALEFTGRQDRSILGLVSQGVPAGSDRIPGVVTAIVDDNDDPADLGRVRVRYPWLGDQAVSFWARLAMPGAGKDSGMVWVPQVGDEVLVAFEQGDPEHPFVIGGLWNGSDAAPLGDGLTDSGKVKRSGFISRGGHKLVFFDDPGESGIALISSNNKLRVSLNETKGQLHVYFDGKLLMEGTGDVEIKTQGDFKVNAQGVTIQGQGQTAIKGATVALN
jgi:uncharacterized protein involved in type VI secretion and phage assembly